MIYDELPVEVVHYIFGFLPVDDLFKLMYVSKDIKNIVDSHDLWQDLFKIYYKNNSIDIEERIKFQGVFLGINLRKIVELCPTSRAGEVKRAINNNILPYIGSRNTLFNLNKLIRDSGVNILETPAIPSELENTNLALCEFLESYNLKLKDAVFSHVTKTSSAYYAQEDIENGLLEEEFYQMVESESAYKVFIYYLKVTLLFGGTLSIGVCCGLLSLPVLYGSVQGMVSTDCWNATATSQNDTIPIGSTVSTCPSFDLLASLGIFSTVSLLASASCVLTGLACLPNALYKACQSRRVYSRVSAYRVTLTRAVDRISSFFYRSEEIPDYDNNSADEASPLIE